ncbi:plasmid p 4b orf-3 family protein [Parachaetomium inaequale]|uniref:Plasmid p 4b orf-3 family protein n=1 Tax=Parachaetomium inaequale TaxID=2588326 RepID=A0AAN6PCL9_9PEZI|nr:plasmid p 4b orf-3 family protein [Parachaetomium inaequale]
MTTSGPKKCDSPSCPKPADSAPATLLLCSRCRTTRYCSQACQAASWPAHKKQCRRQNYIIKFRLVPDDISDPPTAFGWATTHSFDFAVKDPAYTPRADLLAYMQKIRQFHDLNSGPGGGGTDGGGTDSGGMNPVSASREYLLRVTDPVPQNRFSGIDRMHEGKQIVYTYHFGDNWEHTLTVEGHGDFTDHFVCLSWTGHPVAKDVGGVQGWKDLKAAYRTAQPTTEQRERREWFEKRARNADPRGLADDRVNAWDMAQVNRNLVDISDRFDRLAEQVASEKDKLREQIMARSGQDISRMWKD